MRCQGEGSCRHGRNCKTWRQREQYREEELNGKRVKEQKIKTVHPTSSVDMAIQLSRWEAVEQWQQ